MGPPTMHLRGTLCEVGIWDLDGAEAYCDLSTGSDPAQPGGLEGYFAEIHFKGSGLTAWWDLVSGDYVFADSAPDSPQITDVACSSAGEDAQTRDCLELSLEDTVLTIQVP